MASPTTYLCASMVEEATFGERLAAAVGAGYDGIGLRPTHVKAELAEGLSYDDLRARLSDSGLELVEVGFVAGWWRDGEAGEKAVAHERGLHLLSDRLGGARHLMAISGPYDEPLAVMAERFAGVCDRAAEHGLRVGLECLPWTGIPDLATGWEIVSTAGRDNGGVVLDTWHFRRGGSSTDTLRAIPPERIIAIQLSDGRYDVVEGHLEDTFTRRELPGDGDFALGELLGLVRELGISAPVGVEVLSDSMRALPVGERARVGLEATRRLLEPAAASA